MQPAKKHHVWKACVCVLPHVVESVTRLVCTLKQEHRWKENEMKIENSYRGKEPMGSLPITDIGKCVTETPLPWPWKGPIHLTPALRNRHPTVARCRRKKRTCLVWYTCFANPREDESGICHPLEEKKPQWQKSSRVACGGGGGGVATPSWNAEW